MSDFLRELSDWRSWAVVLAILLLFAVVGTIEFQDMQPAPAATAGRR
jgi:hypothetical protein